MLSVNRRTSFSYPISLTLKWYGSSTLYTILPFLIIIGVVNILVYLASLSRCLDESYIEDSS